MSESQTSQAVQPDNIPQFCPICGALMQQQAVDGLLCWVCPECGFTEPV